MIQLTESEHALMDESRILKSLNLSFYLKSYHMSKINKSFNPMYLTIIYFLYNTCPYAAVSLGHQYTNKFSVFEPIVPDHFLILFLPFYLIF